MRVEQTENLALIKHDDYDNQEQNSEQDKRWVDGETLQDTLGRTQNGLNMDNEGEKSAKDDSYASSQSNWTDGIVFTDIRNMCRGPTRCEARITRLSLNMRCFETFKKLHKLNICMHKLRKEVWVRDL